MKLKKKRAYQWCPSEEIVPLDKRKRVRCSVCNRRLLPRELIHDAEVTYKLPPHKTYKLK
jgi:alcohol dehydrogenase class IV